MKKRDISYINLLNYVCTTFFKKYFIFSKKTIKTNINTKNKFSTYNFSSHFLYLSLNSNLHEHLSRGVNDWRSRRFISPLTVSKSINFVFIKWKRFLSISFNAKFSKSYFYLHGPTLIKDLSSSLVNFNFFSINKYWNIGGSWIYSRPGVKDFKSKYMSHLQKFIHVNVSNPENAYLFNALPPHLYYKIGVNPHTNLFMNSSLILPIWTISLSAQSMVLYLAISRMKLDSYLRLKRNLIVRKFLTY